LNVGALPILARGRANGELLQRTTMLIGASRTLILGLIASVAIVEISGCGSSPAGETGPKPADDASTGG